MPELSRIGTELAWVVISFVLASAYLRELSIVCKFQACQDPVLYCLAHVSIRVLNLVGLVSVLQEMNYSFLFFSAKARE